MKMLFAFFLLIGAASAFGAETSTQSSGPSNRFELRTGYDLHSSVGFQGANIIQPGSVTLGINYNRPLLESGVGVAVGMDFLERKFRVADQSTGNSYNLSAYYTDLLWTVSHTTSSRLALVESVTTFLGGFSAVPMGEKQDGSAKVETRFSHGVYFGVSGRMATSNSVDFGINSWVKQGLTAGFSSGAGLDRIFSFGMGVSAIY